MAKALFITFEGIEGAGKSTQVRAVKEHYERQGLSILVTREPGGSPLSDGIRDVLLKSSPHFKIDPIAELLLIEAARRQHVLDILKAGLDQKDMILCDRYCDSTFAYQGGGRGISRDLIRTLNEVATDKRYPDLTILLTMEPEEALQRAMDRVEKSGGKGHRDRFEREALDFHRRVHQTYLELAKEEPSRFFLVDAQKPAAEITKAILSKIDSLRKTPR